MGVAASKTLGKLRGALGSSGEYCGTLGCPLEAPSLKNLRFRV